MKETQEKTKKKISIAHSVDPDDAFMFYALTENVVEQDDFEIVNVLKDIQTLNKESEVSTYDVQAISFSAYPEIEKEYQLMSCGGSLGLGYGPTVIGKKETNIKDLKGQKIAIPGEKTTAYLLLKLLIKDFEPISVPFDEIISSVLQGKYPFGLIIHEGQLSYLNKGLFKIVDLGEWWLNETNLPVPLGGNVIKRSFSHDEKRKINIMIRNSIVYALENKEIVIPKVVKYARDIKNDKLLVDKFVSMYVNDYTIDYGEKGKLAIETLYKKALDAGFIRKIPSLDFVE